MAARTSTARDRSDDAAGQSALRGPVRRWLGVWGGVAAVAAVVAAWTDVDGAYLVVVIALGMIGGALFGEARRRGWAPRR